MSPIASSLFSTEFLALKHKSRILAHSSNNVCGFSMMEQVIMCPVWPKENLLGSSLNQIQGSYSRALEQGPLRVRRESIGCRPRPPIELCSSCIPHIARAPLRSLNDVKNFLMESPPASRPQLVSSIERYIAYVKDLTLT